MMHAGMRDEGKCLCGACGVCIYVCIHVCECVYAFVVVMSCVREVATVRASRCVHVDACM